MTYEEETEVLCAPGSGLYRTVLAHKLGCVVRGRGVHCGCEPSSVRTLIEQDEQYHWEENGIVYRSPRYPGDDQRRGECSGLPACCVAFFVGRWQTFSPGERELYFCSITQAGCTGYIPCQGCLTFLSFVQIKSCRESSCTCGQWATREVVQ